jgi:lysophospholipase L1-like esterase
LRTARAELRAQGIAFVVVVLPHADAIGIPGGPSDSLSTQVSAITDELDVPYLDASDVIRDALARGDQPIQADRSHFNEEGHWLIAKWLHEQLPGAAGLRN